MKTVEQDAARLAFLFDLGIVSAGEVIAWADDAIIRTAKPKHELIELSLSAPSDVSKALRLLSVEIDVWTGVSAALPFVLEVLEEKPEVSRAVAREFYHLAVSQNYTVPKHYSFFLRADDDFDLAESGMFVFDEVYQKFIADIRTAIADEKSA